LIPKTQPTLLPKVRGAATPHEAIRLNRAIVDSPNPEHILRLVVRPKTPNPKPQTQNPKP